MASLAIAPTSSAYAALVGDTLHRILGDDSLVPRFQPIVDLCNGAIIGHEGLIRGPHGSPLESPLELFTAARAVNRFAEVEIAAARTIVAHYARECDGRLFLNFSPETMVIARAGLDRALDHLERLGIALDRVVIELTEQHRNADVAAFRETVAHFRAKGLRFAIDDLGEGYSSLKLWHELQPELVKIDMHFVQNVAGDRKKFEFIRALHQIGEACGTQLVAEGIERVDDLNLLRELGIQYGQGYLVGRPQAAPAQLAPLALFDAPRTRRSTPDPQALSESRRRVTAEKLLIPVPALGPDTTNEEALLAFEGAPDLHALPVVDYGRPIGLINRHSFIATFVRPYFRELYGKRPCTMFMDGDPLRVDKDLSIQELSRTLVGAEQRHLSLGFIITEQDRYLGLGTGHDLIREITRMQIDAARYANPLTLLPGNVPIDDQIERLLAGGKPFVACICDLDHFKPFNDAYGYKRGDEMIKLTARILGAATVPGRDFLGHVGGDDFVLLLQGDDWEARCRAALARFETEARALFDAKDLASGGFHSIDRLGRATRFPLTALSIGAVRIQPQRFRSHLEVSTAAAEAKRLAKRCAGNTLFIEQRDARQGPPPAPRE